MIATGTGIGPFLSILKSDAAWKRFDKIVLCYSVSHGGDLAYLELIEQIAARRQQQFCFVPVVTREAFGEAMRKRIPQLMEDGSLEQRCGITINAEDSHVMMCGSTDMIAEVSAALVDRGMKKHRRRNPGHFTTEKYH